jgi:predicted DNA-binding protein with PD1-like motif
MRSKLLHQDKERTFALVFDAGEEVVAGLERFAAEQGLRASQVTAIGAFESATLGYFDRARKEYLRIPVTEQVEVLSLLGDVGLDGTRPKLHAHVVLGDRSGRTIGGHLLEATVYPTLEVLITDAPAHLHRQFDPATGLALIRLG